MKMNTNHGDLQRVKDDGDDSAFALYMRCAAHGGACSTALEPSLESVLYLDGKMQEFEKVAAACKECHQQAAGEGTDALKQQAAAAVAAAQQRPRSRRHRRRSGWWWRAALGCVCVGGPGIAVADDDADLYWESYAPNAAASTALSSSGSGSGSIVAEDDSAKLEAFIKAARHAEPSGAAIAVPASCADSVEFFDACSSLGSAAAPSGALSSSYGSARSAFSAAVVGRPNPPARAQSGRPLSGQLLSGALSVKRSLAAAAAPTTTSGALSRLLATAAATPAAKPATRGLAPAEPLLMADRDYELVPMPAVTGFAGYWAKDAARSTPAPLPTDELFRSSALVRAAHESINGAFFQDAAAAITFTAKAEAIPAGPLARYAELFSKEHGKAGTWRLRRDLVLTGRTEGRAYFTACGTLILRTAAYNAFATKPCQIMEDYVSLRDDGRGLVLRMCALDVASGRSATQFFVCSYAGDKPPRGW